MSRAALVAAFVLISLDARAGSLQGLCNQAYSWGGSGACPTTPTVTDVDPRPQYREPREQYDPEAARRRMERRREALGRMRDLPDEQPLAPDPTEELKYSLNRAFEKHADDERGLLAMSTPAPMMFPIQFWKPRVEPGTPAQTCADERAEELESARDQACGGGLEGCENVPAGDCKELKKRRLALVRCVKARQKLADECYSGGEPPGEASKSKELEKKMRSCGGRVSRECCPEELRAAKDAACHETGSHSVDCSVMTSCAKIQAAIADLSKCIAAREALRDVCYDGEDDPGHEHELENVVKPNLAACVKALEGCVKDEL